MSGSAANNTCWAASIHRNATPDNAKPSRQARTTRPNSPTTTHASAICSPKGRDYASGAAAFLAVVIVMVVAAVPWRLVFARRVTSLFRLNSSDAM